MHSKQALAVLALAASTATPVLSAPLPENQEQARAALEARLSLGPLLKTIGINAGIGAIPAVISSLTGGDDTPAARELAAREELEARLSLGPLLKTIGINAGIGAIPAVISSLTGGDQNAARELAAELDARGLGSLVGSAVKALENNDSIGKVLGGGLLGGVASGAASVATQDALGGNSRREVDERGLGSLVGSAVKALENNDSIGKVLGGGLLGGVASGAASVATQDALGGNNRREVDERGLGSLVGSAVKALENNDSLVKVLGGSLIGGVASGAASAATQDALGGNNRREPEPLNLGGLGKLLGTGLLGGVASGVGAVVSGDVLGNNRREPEPLNLAGIGKGIAGLVAGLVGSQVASGVLGGSDAAPAQRDLTPEETLAALSLISKRSPEPLNLAGIGKGIAGLVAGLVGSQVASGVLGGSDPAPAQRDLTPEETLAALGLINKRSPEPLNLAGIGKGIAGLVAGLAGSQIAQGVLGGSDPAQRDLTPEETLAALSLISNREIPLEEVVNVTKPPGFHLPIITKEGTLNQLD